MTEAAKEMRNMYMKERYASDEARAARNAYFREWRARNKDKVAAANERYWEKKAQEAAAAK